MPCQNSPEGDTVYAIDNLGVSIPCKNRGDGQYICENILYGKLPVYDSNLCGFKLCDIDVSTGNPIGDVKDCKSPIFPYYIDGTNCELIDSSKNDGLGRLDCCSPGFQSCSLNGQSIDNRYRLSPNTTGSGKNGGNRFTCSGQGCITIPSDYDEKNPTEMKKRFPDIFQYISDTNKKYGTGIFYGNKCNCIKNNTDCKNNGNCEPVIGCGICAQNPGNYSCVYSIDPNNPDNRGTPSCKETPGQGVFNSMQECIDNCSNSKRYSCVNGNCVENSDGGYFSLYSCQGICGKSRINSLGKINIFLVSSIVIMIFILFLILLIVINRVKMTRENV